MFLIHPSIHPSISHKYSQFNLIFEKSTFHTEQVHTPTTNCTYRERSYIKIKEDLKRLLCVFGNEINK